jgi:arylformamidase
MTLARTFNKAGLEPEYALSHLRPELNFLPGWAERSAAFRASASGKLDLAYGPGARDRLDFFPAPDAANAPTVVFIHGGYWQKGDKSTYSFLAEPFLRNGVSFVAVNYDLCPSVRVAQIGSQIRKAMAWLWRNADRLGANRDKSYLMGHSAGGHLTGMMMTTDWPAFEDGLPRDMLKGAIPISGIFELEPLRFTSHNEGLHLDQAEAASESPVNRPPVTDAAQLVACGADESAEFNRQSDLYVETFASSSRQMERYAVAGCHHFEVINELADPESEFFSKVLRLVTAQNA